MARHARKYCLLLNVWPRRRICWGKTQYLTAERQPQLSLRRGDPTAHVRMDATSREVIDKYYDLLDKKTLLEHKLIDCLAQAYNMDETGIPPDPRPPKKKGTRASQKSCWKRRAESSKSWRVEEKSRLAEEKRRKAGGEECWSWWSPAQLIKCKHITCESPVTFKAASRRTWNCQWSMLCLWPVVWGGHGARWRCWMGAVCLLKMVAWRLCHWKFTVQHWQGAAVSLLLASLMYFACSYTLLCKKFLLC